MLGWGIVMGLGAAKEDGSMSVLPAVPMLMPVPADRCLRMEIRDGLALRGRDRDLEWREGLISAFWLLPALLLSGQRFEVHLNALSETGVVC